MLRWSVLLLALLGPAQLAGAQAVTKVLVIKAERRIELISGDSVTASYPIVLGSAPQGHKQKEGDGRTPEGSYLLDWRNPDSAFYRSIHISYPNPADKARAEAANEDPGGMIMIHGQRNYLGWLSAITQMFDWTDGCIAVTDADMDEIWRLVANGTPIKIRP